MTRNPSKTSAEYDVSTQLASLSIDHEAMAVITNIFRVAVTFRNHAERNLLDKYQLSFSGFTVLWVLWIWGRKQSYELAAECGISKGTLTGVVNTLEKKGYVARKPHRTDGRRLFIQLTSRGRSLMSRLFPRINATEVAFTDPLSGVEKRELVRMLRIILNGLPQSMGQDV